MNTNHDHWTEQLSAYIDGELGWDEQAQMEAHLHECAGCAATLNDLRRVVARADGLEDLPPGRELWTGILGRIEPKTASRVVAAADVVDIRDRAGRPRETPPWRRRLLVSIPQLAAAGIAIVLISASAVWLALSGGVDTRLAGSAVDADLTGAPVPTSPMGELPGVTLTGTDVPLVTKYETAIADLEEALRLGEGSLEPGTVATLRRSLAVIDRAIEEAREALAADPHSAYLNAHLADTMRRKMDLLRYANYFATAQS